MKTDTNKQAAECINSIIKDHFNAALFAGFNDECHVAIALLDDDENPILAEVMASAMERNEDFCQAIFQAVCIYAAKNGEVQKVEFPGDPNQN